MKLFEKVNRKLTPTEKLFVLEMAKHGGDATKAMHSVFKGLSDKAARFEANKLMRREDITNHIDYLKQRYQEIEDHVRKM